MNPPVIVKRVHVIFHQGSVSTSSDCDSVFTEPSQRIQPRKTKIVLYRKLVNEVTLSNGDEITFAVKKQLKI